MTGIWLSHGNCVYEVIKREKLPLRKKINPWWWLWNDDEPEPPSWYAGKHLMWWLRNPFHNFTFYVAGVADKNYFIFGTREPVLDGPAPGGWKCHIIGTWFPRPYISYRGRRLIFYIGWRYDGALGCKINWKSPAY